MTSARTKAAKAAKARREAKARKERLLVSETEARLHGTFEMSKSPRAWANLQPHFDAKGRLNRTILDCIIAGVPPADVFCGDDFQLEPVRFAIDGLQSMYEVLDLNKLRGLDVDTAAVVGPALLLSPRAFRVAPIADTWVRLGERQLNRIDAVIRGKIDAGEQIHPLVIEVREALRGVVMTQGAVA